MFARDFAMPSPQTGHASVKLVSSIAADRRWRAQQVCGPRARFRAGFGSTAGLSISAASLPLSIAVTPTYVAAERENRSCSM
jgi:hypothetical protein